MGPWTSVKCRGVKWVPPQALYVSVPQHCGRVTAHSIFSEVISHKQWRQAVVSGDRYCTGTPHTQTRFVNDKQFAGLRLFYIKSASVLHWQKLPGAVPFCLVKAVPPGGILQGPFSKQDFLLLRTPALAPQGPTLSWAKFAVASLSSEAWLIEEIELSYVTDNMSWLITVM